MHRIAAWIRKKTRGRRETQEQAINEPLLLLFPAGDFRRVALRLTEALPTAKHVGIDIRSPARGYTKIIIDWVNEEGSSFSDIVLRYPLNPALRGLLEAHILLVAQKATNAKRIELRVTNMDILHVLLDAFGDAGHWETTKVEELGIWAPAFSVGPSPLKTHPSALTTLELNVGHVSRASLDSFVRHTPLLKHIKCSRGYHWRVGNCLGLILECIQYSHEHLAEVEFPISELQESTLEAIEQLVELFIKRRTLTKLVDRTHSETQSFQLPLVAMNKILQALPQMSVTCFASGRIHTLDNEGIGYLVNYLEKRDCTIETDYSVLRISQQQLDALLDAMASGLSVPRPQTIAGSVGAMDVFDFYSKVCKYRQFLFNRDMDFGLWPAILGHAVSSKRYSPDVIFTILRERPDILRFAKGVSD